MKKIMISAVAVVGLTTISQAQSKRAVQVGDKPVDQAEAKPVENDEIFDHLFLHEYKGLRFLRKIAA